MISMQTIFYACHVCKQFILSFWALQAVFFLSTFSIHLLPLTPPEKKKMVRPLVVDQSFVGLKGSFTVRRMSLNQNTFVLFLSIVLLVFGVTPFKIDQNKKSKPFNRVSPES